MSLSHPIISAILIKKINGIPHVFMQERWKLNSPKYSGLLEIPAGAIDEFENVYDALRREVNEECGLKIVRVVGDYKSENYGNNPEDSFFAFKPFVCQQALKNADGWPWIGFVFVCEVTGEAKMNEHEARNPRWLSMAELKEILEKKPETVFPLQTQVLRYFVENFKE